MSILLDDGRYLMAAWADVYRFFEDNDIKGKVIKNIVSSLNDYCIRDWEEIESSNITQIQSAASTDGYVSLVFEDDSSVEFEIPGNGPIVLGINHKPNIEEVNNEPYSMNQLFSQGIGKKVVDVKFEKTSNKMIFPNYLGIDMSTEDDGINNIIVILEDDSYLNFEGNLDFFCIGHFYADGTSVMVDVSDIHNMKEVRIKLDYSHGPIWKDKYDIATGEWSTGIKAIDNDKALVVLNEAAEKEYSSLYSFNEDSILIFDSQAFENKRSSLLSLIQTIILRLNSLNDGSFRVIDEESRRLSEID